MFKKMFSGGGRSGGASGKRDRSSRKSSGRDLKKQEVEGENNVNRANAMAKTEVRESKFNFPAERMSMIDRLESHQKGSLFKYAVITSEPPKNRGFIMDRLRTYKPPNDHLNARLDDLPPLLLNDEYTEVDLYQAIPDKKLNTKKPFCMIADIFIHYVPMDTFMSTQSTVEFMLTDGRKLEESVVRHASISSNLGYNILFTLDYCVETSDLHEMKLSISRHVSQFKKGKSWAMCKVLIGMDFYDIAKRSNIQESLAVAQFAESDLMEFVTDPRGVDSVVTGEALRQLKLAYKSNDVENLTTPGNDLKKISNAATIVGGGSSLSDMPTGDVITAMKLKALVEERAKSEIIEEEDEPESQPRVQKPKKSAMKKPAQIRKARSPSPIFSGDTEEIDRGDFNNLKEIEMGEDTSQDGDEDNDDDLFEDQPAPFVSKLRFKE
jgi:hypothetical protein